MPGWIQIRVVGESDRPSTEPSALRVVSHLRAQPVTTPSSSGIGHLLRWLILALLLLSGLVGGYRLWAGGFGSDTVAVVNGQPISGGVPPTQALETEITLFNTLTTLVQGQPPSRTISPYDMLNQMIADRLKYQAARKCRCHRHGQRGGSPD